MGLLRLNKDATVTKLTLALFTEDLEDNKELGARVACLEAELADVALHQGHKDVALHALVAAAGAYRVLGQTIQALAYLRRALTLHAGDAETQALLNGAVADLSNKLQKAAPLETRKAAPEPKKVEKAPEPKPESEPEKKPEPEPEPEPEPAPAEPKAEEKPKRRRSKKKSD